MSNQTEIEELEKRLAELKNQEPEALVIAQPPVELKLDLGSGPRPRDGFKGVDWIVGVTDYRCHLWDGSKWPFEDNSVDELHCSHVIEHVKNDYIQTYKGEEQDALLFFFDEAYRIAKPGAVFTVIWPALQTVRAFQDVTHRRFIPHTMIAYISREGRKAMGVDHYVGECDWIGTVNPTMQHEETLRSSEIQAKRFNECWNTISDFWANLKANKP